MTTMTVVTAPTQSALDFVTTPSGQNVSDSSSSPSNSFSSVMAEQQERTQPSAQSSADHPDRDPSATMAEPDESAGQAAPETPDASIDNSSSSLSDQFFGIAQAVLQGWQSPRTGQTANGAPLESSEVELEVADDSNELLMTASPTLPSPPTSSQTIPSASSQATPGPSLQAGADATRAKVAALDSAQGDDSLNPQQLRSTPLSIGEAESAADAAPAAPTESAPAASLSSSQDRASSAQQRVTELAQTGAHNSSLDEASTTATSTAWTASTAVPQNSSKPLGYSAKNSGSASRDSSAEASSRELAQSSRSDTLFSGSSMLQPLHESTASSTLAGTGAEFVAFDSAASSATSSSTSSLLPGALSLDSHSGSTPSSSNVQSGSLSSPLGSASWAQELSDQMLQQTQWQGRYGLNGLAQQQIELSLNPADLGPLHIVLSVNDGVAQASFISPHAAVRDSVETALPQLQQALANAGLSLGQANVGADHAQPEQQRQGGEDGAQADAQATLENASEAAATSDDEALITAARPQRSNALLDTFA
jgi:flagellar hook-length control protein FliK